VAKLLNKEVFQDSALRNLQARIIANLVMHQLFLLDFESPEFKDLVL